VSFQISKLETSNCILQLTITEGQVWAWKWCPEKMEWQH